MLFVDIVVLVVSAVTSCFFKAIYRYVTAAEHLELMKTSWSMHGKLLFLPSRYFPSTICQSRSST